MRRFLASVTLLLSSFAAHADTFADRPEVKPHLTSGPVIIVNIPEFKLRFYRDGELQLESRVILGREDRQTPEMETAIQHIIFNPYWNLSSKLARTDVLPKYQWDQKGFERSGYEFVKGWELDAPVLTRSQVDIAHCIKDGVCPFRVRQRPGPGNFLGRVKFSMPNPYDVFIHDTPGRSLFARKKRTFSSGCIRTEHPLELAEAILGHPVDDLVATGERQEIYLPEPVKVMVMKLQVPGGIMVYQNRMVFAE